MIFFKSKKLFDKNFLLDDEKLLFKSSVSFSYANIYNDHFVVQGFTISRDYCMISAYSKKHAKSRVYLYEKNGLFKKYIELDNSSHVGGITYDYINNVVYITDIGGRVNAYDYFEFISGNISKFDVDINISKYIAGITSAATVYFYDNKLYVCTFEGIGKMIVYDLKFFNNKIRVLDVEVFDNMPSAIQGVLVFKYKDELYYAFSQSYSRLKSVIKLFDNNMCFLGQIKLNKIGLEGIDIEYNGFISGVFENGIDKIGKIHISDVCHKRSLRGEKKFYFKGVKFQEKLVKLKESI